jgi:hypothetical protein
MGLGVVVAILFLILEKKLSEREMEMKRIFSTKKGEKVRSAGEVKIADWLFEHNIEYQYAQRREVASQLIRPNFYLSRVNTVIEYWEFVTPSGRSRTREWKEGLYHTAGMTLISLEPKDLENLDSLLSSYLMKKE